MGRSTDSSDSEDATRRKVVLLRPHTAAADSAAGPERRAPPRREARAASVPKAAPGARQAGRTASGPAGRILEWLAKNEGHEAPSRPARPAPKQKPPLRSAAARHLAAAMKAPTARRDTSPGRPVVKKAAAAPRAAVNALKLMGESALRSASPCSPEPPAARTAARKAKNRAKRRQPATTRRRSSSSESAAPAPASPAPAPKKRRKASVKPAKAAEAPAAPSPEAPKAPKAPKAVTPPQQRALIAQATGEGSFQAAVLERLRQMCGEHEDAKVLAEYIVVMVAGNKGREEMTVELQPFFQDVAQASSFVDWVEECKWKFLTGDRASPKHAATHEGASPPSRPRAAGPEASPSPPREREEVQASPPAETSAVSVSASPSPPPSVRARQPAESALPAGAGSVFEVPPLSASARSAPAVPAKASAPAEVPQPLSAKAAATSPVFSKAAAAARVPNLTGVRQKTELLKNMTKQLQVILTKLSDKSLNDGTREKYQALAQSIQTQMAKITSPQSQASQARRRA